MLGSKGPSEAGAFILNTKRAMTATKANTPFKTNPDIRNSHTLGG
jgi:hypothetical protein